MKKEVLLETVQKIIKHPSFGRSDTYANLLLFLAECTLENRIPKETDIATAIFGKKDFDPSQSTQVRVYVYKLRKKIQRYYQSEDVKDRYRLTIPKGSYKVVLEERSPGLGNNFFSKLPRVFWPLLGLMVLTVLWWFFYNERSLPEPTPLTALLQSERPKTVALGDYFLFREYVPGKRHPRVVRTDIITSTPDFEHFVQNESDSTLQYGKVNTTTIPFEIGNCINILSVAFAEGNKTFDLKKNSDFDPDLLRDHDIIALGTLNNLTKFNKIPRHYRYELKSKPTLIYENGEEGIKKTYQPSFDQNSRTDYCVISKTRGPNGNDIIVFGSLWSIALEPAVHYFTESRSMEQLLSAFSMSEQPFPPYFEVLLQVTSIGHTALDTKIVHFDLLNGDDTQWD